MSDYQTAYDKIPANDPVICGQCSWSGTGEDLTLEVFSEVLEVNCPKCDGRIQLLMLPTEQDVADAAVRGNPEAMQDLARIRSPKNLARRAAPTIRMAEDVPTVPDGTFGILLDLDYSRTEDGSEDCYLNILADGEEIWREPLFWEGYEGIVQLIDAIAESYGPRMRSLEAAQGIIDYSSGDGLSAPGTIQAAIDRATMAPKIEWTAPEIPVYVGEAPYEGDGFGNYEEVDAELEDLREPSDLSNREVLEEEVHRRVFDPDRFDEKSIVSCKLEDLASSLARILEELKADPRRWIVILEIPGPARYYVQVLLRSDGAMFSECISDEYLDDEHKLTEDQREILPTLGWWWPGPPSTPNWHFSDELLHTGTAVGGLLLRTLRQVFSLREADRVNVIFFPVESDD